MHHLQQKVHYLLLLLILQLHVHMAVASEAVSVKASDKQKVLQSEVGWLVDVDGSYSVNDFTSSSSKNNFVPFNQLGSPLKPENTYWATINLINRGKADTELMLYAGDWTNATMYVVMPNGTVEEYTTGRLLPLHLRSIKSKEPYFKALLLKNQATEIYFKLQNTIQGPGLYDGTIKVESLEQYEQQAQNRLLLQGIFLGIILVMIMYNLVLYFSVHDQSYLYYVLSIAGVGLYYCFYYGFTIELLWPAWPRWDLFSFAFILPLTGIARILFTRSYLNLHELHPACNRLFKHFAWLYLLPMALGLGGLLFNWQLMNVTIQLIGVMGVVVISGMIIAAAITLQRGFQPARHFLIANILFALGSILFIFREVGLLPDTAVTQYAAQFGVIAQLILFSLGLAYRITRMQQDLNERKLEQERLEREKEIERKQLIEAQKTELKVLVAKRTADLNKKTHELEHTVTRLKLSEANYRQLNELKNKFFSIISHDLKSPVAVLDAFLNILINFPNDLSADELRVLAERTNRSVKNLVTLLDNLLQWSRSQMDALDYRPEPIPLSDAVQQITELLQTNAELKNISLTYNNFADIIAWADRNMLEFILRNLISNAIKFTAPGGHVNISGSKTGKFIKIDVMDDGVGIAAEDLQHLFRLDRSNSTKGTANEAGTGLGLILCKEMVQKCGGQIKVSSQPGQGSVFSFTLPAGMSPPLESTIQQTAIATDR